MDWIQINKNCPKAFESWSEKEHTILYGNTTSNTSQPMYKSGGLYHFRSLYDFFDSYNLFICVDKLKNDELNKWFFYSTVTNDREPNDEDLIYRESDDSLRRIEVEEWAFEKAFEILEEKLNQ